MAEPDRAHWKPVVPESDATVESLDIVKQRIVVRDLVNATARVRLFQLDGTALGTIPLPTVGTVGEGMGEPEGEDFVFSFQSFFVPPALYRYRIDSGRVTAFETLEAGIDSSRRGSRSTAAIRRFSPATAASTSR